MPLMLLLFELAYCEKVKWSTKC